MFACFLNSLCLQYAIRDALFAHSGPPLLLQYGHFHFYNISAGL